MLPRGLEPRTLGLLDLRSDQLSYESAYKMNLSMTTYYHAVYARQMFEKRIIIVCVVRPVGLVALL